MKRTTQILVKGLLLIVLFSSISIVMNTMGVKTTNVAQASVSGGDVYKYLTCHGYKVYSLSPIQGTDNWVAHTYINEVHFTTTIFVEGDQIIDHEDIPM